MLLSKLEAGPTGFDYRIFECHNCSRVHTMIVSSDPTESDLHGWLEAASEELPHEVAYTERNGVIAGTEAVQVPAGTISSDQAFNGV
jgi:hypothetical protein